MDQKNTKPLCLTRRTQWIALRNCVTAFLSALCINGHALAEKPSIAATSESEKSLPLLFDSITTRAKALSQSDFKPLANAIPEAFAKMDYDQYRSIRFRTESSLWRDEAKFEIQLFHAGYIFKEPVVLHTVQNGTTATIPFKQSLFNYEGTAAPLSGVAPSNLGYAGFRVHFPLNNSQYKDEFITFQGASSSYFRMLGPHQAYGISARGLAIDTAESNGEEFPIFREYWMLKPKPAENHVVIYALLDSLSVTGAYRFDAYPGLNTEIKITARIFARKNIKKIGIAPLTSMFLFGENSINASRFDDFRAEVHDSDGLLMQTVSGEWVWRALNNHRRLHVTSLADTNPQGFGLIQRDRDLSNYIDLEAKYEKRPSLWVKPENAWGKGRVELVEIPSDSETNDNIVAYWVPDQAMKAGESREFKYSLKPLDGKIAEQSVATVVQTRTGWGSVAGLLNPPPKSKRQFVIDFQGGELDKFTEGNAVEAEISKSSGTVSDLHTRKLPDGKTYRVSFKLVPDANNVVDMRVFLKAKSKRLSEVWSYVWYPDEL